MIDESSPVVVHPGLFGSLAYDVLRSAHIIQAQPDIVRIVTREGMTNRSEALMSTVLLSLISCVINICDGGGYSFPKGATRLGKWKTRLNSCIRRSD